MACVRIWLLVCCCGIFSNTQSQDASFDRDAVLRVAVSDVAPYGYLSRDGNLQGVMVDLWREIGDRLNLRYDFYLMPVGDAIEGVRRDSFDLAVGAITVTPERQQLVDFSNSVCPSGTAVAVAIDKVPSKFKVYYRPILISLGRIVIALFGFMLASALAVWIVERKNRHHEHERQIRHFGDGIWWSAVTISTVGYGDKVPHTPTGRLIGIAWIFIGITLVSLFTANAAAILSNADASLDITEADLREWQIGAVENSSAASYLDRRNIKFVPYESIDGLVGDVRAGKLEAMIGKAPNIRYLTELYPEELKMGERWLEVNYMAFAISDEHPLSDEIDAAILAVTREERWQNEFARYIIASK